MDEDDRNEFRDEYGLETVRGKIHKISGQIWRVRKRGQRFPEFLAFMIGWMLVPFTRKWEQ